MTAPEVQYVLNQTRDEYPTGESLPAIPLERIDRDNSDRLDPHGDEPTHTVTEDLEEVNLISADLVSRPEQPSGTNYNLAGDAIVSVRVEGAHVSEGGAIDPQAGTPQNATYASWNTTDWDSLTDNIRRAIFTNRTFPNVGRANTSYKDLFIENWNDDSQNYGDYYLLTFDVRMSGYEDLP